eukprot:TRINITY_DN10333_c0_g1_i3.p1 TRINITY_DN10333_c0_g1~~TRINITY_DN10333_c0_g1_i3.p1  ORF type:complete len:109 (+),score=12.71 TRINITY_DN10333_c0_g1_i3:73-399(+)
MSYSVRVEKAERQLAELDSLEAIYFEDGAVTVDDVARTALKHLVETPLQECGVIDREELVTPPLAFSVLINGQDGGPYAMRLSLVLPCDYPAGLVVPNVFVIHLPDKP